MFDLLVPVCFSHQAPAVHSLSAAPNGQQHVAPFLGQVALLLVEHSPWPVSPGNNPQAAFQQSATGGQSPVNSFPQYPLGQLAANSEVRHLPKDSFPWTPEDRFASPTSTVSQWTSLWFGQPWSYLSNKVRISDLLGGRPTIFLECSISALGVVAVPYVCYFCIFQSSLILTTQFPTIPISW